MAGDMTWSGAGHSWRIAVSRTTTQPASRWGQIGRQPAHSARTPAARRGLPSVPRPRTGSGRATSSAAGRSGPKRSCARTGVLMKPRARAAPSSVIGRPKAVEIVTGGSNYGLCGNSGPRAPDVRPVRAWAVARPGCLIPGGGRSQHKGARNSHRGIREDSSLTPSPSPEGRGEPETETEATDSISAPIRERAPLAQTPDLPGACPAIHFHTRRAAALAHVVRQAGRAGQVPATASHRTLHRRLFLQGSAPRCRSGWRSSLSQASTRPPSRRLADGCRLCRPSSAQSPNPALSGPRPGPDPSSPLRHSSGAPLPSGEGLGVRLHVPLTLLLSWPRPSCPPSISVHLTRPMKAVEISTASSTRGCWAS
jgi:hypothetical protein